MNRLLVPLRHWLETSSPRQKLTAAVLLFSVLCTIGLIAMQGASGVAGDPLETTPFYFIGVFAKLVIVLLLIAGSSILFRRWMQPGPGGRKSRQVQLLETVRLSPKQALHLITVGDQQLLVGATDQGISLITQLELDLDTVEPETTMHQPVSDFASLMQTLNIPVKFDGSS